MEYLTVKEISNELEISTQAIYKRLEQIDNTLNEYLNNLPLNDQLKETKLKVKKGNKTLYLSIYLELLKYKSVDIDCQLVDNLFNPKLHEKTNQETTDITDILELKHKIEKQELENKNYKERLEVLKQQNEQQKEQIDTLLKLLDQAQQLQAMAENKVQLLEQKEKEQEQNQEPKKWYQFWK